MRDPEGEMYLCGPKVIRRLADANSPSVNFLHTKLAGELVEDQLLIPFNFLSNNDLESPRLPFVSYPHEWCDAQLRAAGKLTIEISKYILKGNYELKDASAWNVIFDGVKPIFCDHLSFQQINRPEWWAFGQFTRHFLFPLGISKRRGVKSFRLFSSYRDGIPASDARELLGYARYLTRLWPLLIKSRPESATELSEGLGGRRTPLHGRLYSYVESLISNNNKNSTKHSHWAEYEQSKNHYSENAAIAKRQQVGAWIEHIKPRKVLDLGCNTGEFTRLAAKSGADVIALDVDHDCVEKLFEQCEVSDRISPLIADLTDISGGRGWAGEEFPSLVARLEGCSDLVLVLALLHHIIVAEGMGINHVVNLLARLSANYMIIEIVDPIDPMMSRLALQRNRNISDMSRKGQRAALEQHFDVIESVDLPDINRSLLLLKNRKYRVQS